MTSHVRIEGFQLTGNEEVSAPSEARLARATRGRQGRAGNASAEQVSSELLAQTLEFVARPGQTEKLQKALQAAMRKAQENCEGFVGCLVLVSEQEERLVTVITLWTGGEKKQQEETCSWVKNLIEPYVDSWLRPRRFVKLLSLPEIFGGAIPGAKGSVLIADRVA